MADSRFWLVGVLVLLLGCPGGLIGDDDSGGADDDAGDDDAGDDDAAPDCSGGPGVEPGPHFLEAAGESAWFFVPPGLPPCAPLFLFGHGGASPGGTSPEGMWTDGPHTDLVPLADERDFVVMVPFLEDAPTTDHPWSTLDVGPMEQMIAAVAADVDIDRHRVIFAGVSAGGVMAAYWGLYEPEVPSHFGVFAAGFGGQIEYPPQDPDPMRPFLVGHDPDDELAPYSLSEEFVAVLTDHGFDVTFIDTDVGGNGHGWAPGVTEATLEWWLGP